MLGSSSYPSRSVTVDPNGPSDSKPIVDGFTYTLSRIPGPYSYYWNCVAMLTNLRRANGYRFRVYNVPDEFDEPVPATKTLEYQVRVQPGTYLWGLQFAVIVVEDDGASPSDIIIRITDACTETPLFSDYPLSTSQAETTAGIGLNRTPCLISSPLLVGPPGLLNVEISNRSTSLNITCQLLLLVAEPSLPTEELQDIMRRYGYYD